MSKLAKARTKVPTTAVMAPATSHFQTRPFGLEAEPTQPARPTNGGYSFGAVSVHRSTPLVVQPKLKLGQVKDSFTSEMNRTMHQIGGENSSVRPQPEWQEAEREPLKENNTGLPDTLKAKIENLSGMSMDDVKVHYNSVKPAQLQALAYTQGRNIYIGPRQEKHLAHEAWHVVQQKQGQVWPTIDLHGAKVNNDLSLEQEADVMSTKALQLSSNNRNGTIGSAPPDRLSTATHSSQCSCPACIGGLDRISNTAVIQRQCDYCHNPMCNDGDVCGNKKTTYGFGQHGNKLKEQQRLSQQFGFKVSGATHQSEHTIGFAVLNQTSNSKRGESGPTKVFENNAPAYQEMTKPHRDHIGTGNSNTRDESGFTSSEYRNSQRNLLESGDVSSVVQINQLGYSQNPNFQTLSKTAQGQAANNSYRVMVGGMGQVTYATGNTYRNVRVTKKDQAEMIAARMMAELGRYLFPDEIAKIYEDLAYWDD